MSWGDTSFVGLVLESTSGTIAKLIYFGADAKRSKNTEGTVVNCILVFTSTCGGLKKVTNAWTPLVGPWPINLGSLGFVYDSWPINRKIWKIPGKSTLQNMASLENSCLQPWEHHEYLRPGTPGIGRNHPECWKALIYRPFCVWYVETDKSRKKLRCSDSLTLGFIDYPV